MKIVITKKLPEHLVLQIEGGLGRIQLLLLDAVQEELGWNGGHGF